MSFMEPEITDRMEWLFVDGPMGAEYIPSTVVQMPTPAQMERMRQQQKPHKPWTEYLENREIWQIKIIRGYGVRLQAPGYLDATAWDVYTVHRAAQRAARQLEKGEV